MVSTQQVGNASKEIEVELSEFERRELERRRSRVAIYDAIAEGRARWIEQNSYYAEEVQRLVGSLVLPNSRILEIGCGLGDLLASLGGKRSVGVDISSRMVELARVRHPGLDFRVGDVERDAMPEGPFDAIIFSDAVGHLDDIQRAFEQVRPLLAPTGRMIVTYYNFVWEPILKAAEMVGRKTPWPDQNWLSMQDIGNLLHLSGYEVVRHGTDILVPANVPVVSQLANRIGAQIPILRETALVDYFVARGVEEPMISPLPGVSVICPTRNEKGNIHEAIRRTPMMGPRTELIFVDGNSNDGTVEEIQAAIAAYKGPLELSLVFQGDGKGKGDAVRKGFAAATGDVLMILDADLTMPPEALPKYHAVIETGKAEFVNGTRLIYPMEHEAMRPLNFIANRCFAYLFSYLVNTRLTDTLCGTKVLLRKDYEVLARERGYFGNFDPFGDFDLIFGAAKQNLKILETPIHYKARTFGETQISRFRDGWLLLKMVWFAYRKLKAI